MKIGIYISGLCQSVVDESVEKYAARFINEMSFSTTNVEYEMKTEKINYTTDKDSTVVTICDKSTGEAIYKIYDYKYHEILTEKFNSHSLLRKSLWLFLLVARKLPLIVKRLFMPTNYNKPALTLYLFIILMIIACAILLMLPATFSLVGDFFNTSQVNEVMGSFGIADIPLFSKSGLEAISKTIVSLTALMLLILPNANVLITNIATEFVCANDYIEHGAQRQFVQGNLEKLVDYISENETDCKIHFHSYSFGSILAIDYIYPSGTKPTKNAYLFCEALITIGAPFEFINSYYSNFYKMRLTELGEKLCWINVYSIADALATNFRNDKEIGESQFGITPTSIKPINVNYEGAALKKIGIIDFIMLYSIKIHGMYWDSKVDGQSCLRSVLDEMNSRNLIYSSEEEIAGHQLYLE